MRDFGFFGVKKYERKLPNERGRYGVWDDPKDVELEKQKRNLGTEDGVGSEYTKMIKLFILKVDSHISHYVGWEAQSTTFPIMFHVTIKQHYYEVT